jgi:excisionase family DNA binding protein
MSPTVTDRPLLSVRQAAQKLNVSEKTIRRLIRRGEVPALWVGGQQRLDQDELETWLYSESPAGVSPPFYPAREDPTERVDPSSGVVDSTQPVGKEEEA